MSVCQWFEYRKGLVKIVCEEPAVEYRTDKDLQEIGYCAKHIKLIDKFLEDEADAEREAHALAKPLLENPKIDQEREREIEFGITDSQF